MAMPKTLSVMYCILTAVLTDGPKTRAEALALSQGCQSETACPDIPVISVNHCVFMHMSQIA
jgi:hypothetical protein